MFQRFSSAPAPCLRCNKEEFRLLREEFEGSGEKFWVYNAGVQNCCSRCDYAGTRSLWARYPILRSTCCVTPYTTVQVPIPSKVVGQVERALHSSSITTSGSDFRAHGSFISLLSTMDCEEEYKQALCCWAPLVMKAFNEGRRGISRILRKGRQYVVPDLPPIIGGNSDESPIGVSPRTTSGPGALPSATIKSDDLAALSLPPANPGTEDGMKGTIISGDEYGEEKRVYGCAPMKADAKNLAYQIGPDLIPTEVFESSVDNLRGGMAKRVQPLPFKASKQMIRKIDRTVSCLLKTVFSPEKIKQWRLENPMVEEFCSSKWSPQRFREAYDEAMSETRVRIEQTFQIKVNEALPAKGKAPRPIIQCGDRAQVLMSLPVKCFEELLFEFFEKSSIKHVPKYDAMKRVAEHLHQPGAHLIEGDGSAWDACCNSKIRAMTENRILRQIIQVLGSDPEVPQEWMETVLTDMEKLKLKGKAKVSDFCLSPIRVCIESIRQSGHRGTSCFNYLINLVCWLCVLCEKPELMIRKSRDGELQSKYVSAFDHKEYYLKYSFEGDDSALSTTEDVSAHAGAIEGLWTSLGFRMKLVFAKQKLTFTGFDFLCDEKGPTGLFIPEVARNIASSSWTTSSLVKQYPHKASEVGAAAMLARANNFKDCGPLCAYFAALGLAHVKRAGDRGIEFAEAKALAVDVSPSIKDALQELYDGAGVMEKDMDTLLKIVGIDLTPERQCALLRADFGNNPTDLILARKLIPFTVWDPANFSSPRR